MSREDPEFNHYVDEIHEQVIEEIQRLYEVIELLSCIDITSIVRCIIGAIDLLKSSKHSNSAVVCKKQNKSTTQTVEYMKKTK